MDVVARPSPLPNTLMEGGFLHAVSTGPAPRLQDAGQR